MRGDGSLIWELPHYYMNDGGRSWGRGKHTRFLLFRGKVRMKEDTEAWTETPTRRVITDSNNRMGLGTQKISLSGFSCISVMKAGLHH